MREFNIGDTVMLTLDAPGTVGITEGLREYKDRIFRITKRKMVAPKTKTAGCRCIYFELGGCESKYGVPYAVTEDWIVPIKEARK